MAKNKISEWSSTPSNNTDVGGIDIAEGCAPSGINNAIREMMAQVKDMQAGTDGDNLTVGGNLAVTGTVTLSTSLPLTSGGTGAATADAARTNLGLGTISTQAASAVAITGGTITGLSSAIPVLSGGTGSTTATGSGSVVLATSPTLVTPALGTPSAVVLTNASGTANSLNAGLGVNQTWSNPSNSHNTSYQNTTGKPIMINYGGSSGGKNVWTYLKASSDNTTWITVAQAFTSADDDINGGSLSAIIPNNWYYKSDGTAWSNSQWAVLS